MLKLRRWVQKGERIVKHKQKERAEVSPEEEEMRTGIRVLDDGTGADAEDMANKYDGNRQRRNDRRRRPSRGQSII